MDMRLVFTAFLKTEVDPRGREANLEVSDAYESLITSRDLRMGSAQLFSSQAYQIAWCRTEVGDAKIACLHATGHSSGIHASRLVRN